MQPVHVVCLKWGDKYPAEYVNRLYRMVKNNCHRPFEFHCLTENATGLDTGVNVLALELESGLKGWWYKLQLFKPDFYGLTGQVMFLDLDVVITQNITPLFDFHPDDFVIIKDLQAGKVYNSSVFKFNLGSQTQVWHKFIEDKNAIMARMHGDQDWVSEVIDNAVLWPEGWVVSFKKECDAKGARSFGHLGKLLRRFGLLQATGQAMPPSQAKIVYFHGKPDPDDVAYGPSGMWRYAPWIVNAWK